MEDAIEDANRTEMGVIVSNRVADTWRRIYDRGAEYDRNREKMVDDVALLLESVSHPLAREQAQRTVSDWERRNLIFRPSQPADFLVDLDQFREAVSLFVKGLQDGTEYYEEEDWAFVSFIAGLSDWMHTVRLKTGASKGQYPGKITSIAAAVNEIIPELKDDAGNRLPKQIKRPTIELASLSAQITKAQRKYEAARPSNTGPNDH